MGQQVNLHCNAHCPKKFGIGSSCPGTDEAHVDEFICLSCRVQPLGISYVSWDPGDTTGACCWNDKAEPVKMGPHMEFKGDKERDDFLDTLEGEPIKKFIIEEYRVYGSKIVANVGSKVYTAQVIGDLKSWARRRNVQVVEQRSDIKEIGCKWAQVPYKKNSHMPDWRSAYIHGYYYLHKSGLIRPKVLDSDL